MEEKKGAVPNETPSKWTKGVTMLLGQVKKKEDSRKKNTVDSKKKTKQCVPALWKNSSKDWRVKGNKGQPRGLQMGPLSPCGKRKAVRGGVGD